MAGEFVVADIDLALPARHLRRPGVRHARQGGRRSACSIRTRQSLSLIILSPHRQPRLLPCTSASESMWQGSESMPSTTLAKGICHQLLPERGYVRPGMLIVGTDSHTTTHGALGAGGTGIGTSDMVYALATGRLWFRVPETIRFELTRRSAGGRCHMEGCDLASRRTIRRRRRPVPVAMEFGGPAVQNADMSSRLTVSNMAVEMGAKFGLFAADEITDSVPQGSRRTKGPQPFAPDPDATYEAIHEISLTGSLTPQIAMPNEVDNVGSVSDAAGLSHRPSVHRLMHERADRRSSCGSRGASRESTSHPVSACSSYQPHAPF